MIGRATHRNSSSETSAASRGSIGSIVSAPVSVTDNSLAALSCAPRAEGTTQEAVSADIIRMESRIGRMLTPFEDDIIAPAEKAKGFVALRAIVAGLPQGDIASGPGSHGAAVAREG
jgi:hypothetical protein